MARISRTGRVSRHARRERDSGGDPGSSPAGCVGTVSKAVRRQIVLVVIFPVARNVAARRWSHWSKTRVEAWGPGTRRDLVGLPSNRILLRGYNVRQMAAQMHRKRRQTHLRVNRAGSQGRWPRGLFLRWADSIRWAGWRAEGSGGANRLYSAARPVADQQAKWLCVPALQLSRFYQMAPPPDAIPKNE
jgi:hypothetical protein